MPGSDGAKKLWSMFFWTEVGLAAKEQWIFGALHNLFDSLELDVRFVTSISGVNTLDLKCLKLRSWAGSDGAMDQLYL